ncbi:sce7726 family protein [Thiovibrio frasassiensis]|uniref:Sce7726 family protein n=1 Tax=Thiovibrio frasassiensis TaxID=2984131 RepID=A0A9X4MD36_9BACT|nr:sce7726 family protein [Thiovibrio frasassiensis]MDG4475394.1 sce7726 family protein [Thiovibrio frasassiensis]
MTNLGDREIRSSLIRKLKQQVAKPKAIIEELRVHNGNAIADVVALYTEAHCFEIKGDGDKVERITEQGQYYNSSFRKITLVTTRRHVSKALSIAPNYWGIMVAEEINDQVTLRYVRRAKNNANFDKGLALMTLWKSEMLSLTYGHNKTDKKKSREILAELISASRKKAELSKEISELLFTRHLQAKA